MNEHDAVLVPAEELARLRLNEARYLWIRSHLDDDEDYHLMEHKKGIDYGMKQYAKLDLAIDAQLAKVTP